ncbi:hypothetical protein HK096_005378 [Nowakowskiella sp. JEL0078]|nr:hypothetical protein HK096_005378 [Nowakowskiella sp. JEL0078]
MGETSTSISGFYAIPFFGLLLSIAIIPLIPKLAHFWEKFYWTIAVFWSLAVIIPFSAQYSLPLMGYQLVDVLLSEYIPFVLMVGSLFVVAGGIVLEGKLSGTPLANTLLLLVGIPLCSLLGTTGASMVLIRPLLRSISHRSHDYHSVVFFIIIISNVAGGLTPIGNPPVFIGYLRGVDFFWPIINVSLPTLLSCGYLLIVYFLIDTYYYRKEPKKEELLLTSTKSHTPTPLKIEVQNPLDLTLPITQNSDSDIETLALSARTPKFFGGLETPKSPLWKEDNYTPKSSRSVEFVDADIEPLDAPPAIPVGSFRREMTLVETSDDPELVREVVSKEEEEIRIEKQTSRWVVAERFSRRRSFRIRGWGNVFLILMIAVVIVLAGVLQKTYPDAGVVVMKEVVLGKTELFIHYASIGQNILLLVIPILSFISTPAQIFIENNFTWTPLIEVAILFANIFITLKPILMMFDERESGPLGFIITAISQPWQFFWVTGIMSGFLDNAPTYLLFFDVAGGDPQVLMTTKAQTLIAINAGACFFGALSYIGNAPNMLVRNVAEESGIKMPSFVMYMAWSFVVLTPIFLLDTVVFFR